MEQKLIGVPDIKYEELDDDFKCGVCKQPLFLAPVFTCKSVGSLCGSCSPGYHQPHRKPIDPEDDDAVEQRAYVELALLVWFPCCFTPCDTLIDAENQSVFHFDDCLLKTIKCPISAAYRSYLYDLEDQCDWEGKEYASLVEHVQEAHSKYILTDPIKIDLKLFDGSNGRKLFITINGPDLISLIMIEYMAKMFTIGFRQNKQSICYYELIPSGSEGNRLWSYLYNGPMFGPLGKHAKKLVQSDTSRVIEIHIEQRERNYLFHGKSPKFYLSPVTGGEPQVVKEEGQDDEDESTTQKLDRSKCLIRTIE